MQKKALTGKAMVEEISAIADESVGIYPVETA